MRKLVWFTLGFAAACFVCAYCYCEYLVWFMLGALVLCVAGFLCMRYKRVFRIAAAVFLGMGIGFAGFMLYDGLYLQPVRSLDGQLCDMLIVAEDYNLKTNYGSGAEGTVAYNGMTYRVRFYLDEEKTISPGDAIRGTFKLRFTADGGDDVSPQYRGKGIFLTAIQEGEVQAESGTEFSVRHYPAVWRRELKMGIDSAFPADVSAVVKGLLLGDRTDLDYETETAFKVSGISHIIAVSGLHISILFGLISFLTFRRRWLTAIIAIPALILFAAVVGFTPSVTRACIMYVLMLISWLFLREYDAPTELAFAVLVMLVANPLAITSVSLQLSTACMIGIYMFSGKLRAWILAPKRLGGFDGIKGKLAKWFASSVSITLGSMVFTTPLCAYYFGTVSLVGIVTNLLTLWVVSIAFYGIVAVCMAGFVFPAVAAGLGWLFAWPIRYVIWFAKLLAGIPFAAVYTQSSCIVIWLVIAYALFGGFLLLKKKRPLILATAVLASLVLAIGASCLVPSLDDYRFTILNVGNGQCIFLQTEGRTFVVDCGGDYDKGVADDAAEMLLSQGITRVDGMILTHFDRDHAGGAAYFLTRMDVDTLFLPVIDDTADTAADIARHTNGVVQYVQENTKLQFGTSELTIFPAQSANSRNESGLCILLCTAKCDILITGDRGKTGESQLVAQNDLPDIEVLVAGHHGAGNSTTDALLGAVKPEYAVISVGKDNPYGHPAQAVIDRLEKRGCHISRTDLDGTILFRG